MDGDKGNLHVWCCHWLATSAAFNTKVALWTMGRVRDECLHTGWTDNSHRIQSKYDETFLHVHGSV